MKQKLILAGLTTAALGVSPGGAFGAGAVKKCGNSGTAITNIQANKTSCSVAKKVARADVRGKRYDGWTCRSRRTATGANVTCTHKGGGKVSFQVADKP